MDFSQYVLLAAVIAGVTELLKRLRAADYWGAANVLSAAVIGGVFGLFGVESLNLVTGLAAGFGAAGALVGVGFIGTRSPATPSNAVVAGLRAK